MSDVLQLLAIVLCLLFLVYVVRLVAKERLLLKYSLLWLLLAVVVLVVACFPRISYWLSGLLGFITPSNFIFFVGLFCLMAIALSLSVIVSRQTLRIKDLTQRIALLEHELRASRKSAASQHTQEDRVDDIH